MQDALLTEHTATNTRNGVLLHVQNKLLKWSKNVLVTTNDRILEFKPGDI